MALSKLWNWVKQKQSMGYRLWYETIARESGLAEFGFKGVREDHFGIQYIIELQHCEISFWNYKADVGSAITPISSDPNIRYASKQIDEKHTPGDSRPEIERQISIIKETYRDILLGDFGDWPKDTD